MISLKQGNFRTIKNIKKNYKDIDVLINLAAVQIFADFEKGRLAEIDLMLNVNIRAKLNSYPVYF